MIQSFWSFFTKNRSVSYLLVVTLLAFGIFSIFSIPKESSPDVQIPVGIVSVSIPGASAEEIERLATNKLEQRIKSNLSDVQSITSTSNQSFATIVVEFRAQADLEKSIRSLRDTVDAARPLLPSSANDPQVSEINFVNQPVVTFAIGSNLPERILITIAENVERELSAIQGVSEITIDGLRAREVQVVVRKRDLETYSLTLSQVVGAIRSANSASPLGDIIVDNISYNVQFENAIERPEDLSSVVISSQGGSVVYLRDVADIYDGLEEASALSRLSLENSPSVSSLGISVFQRSGGNIAELTKLVNQKLDELQEDGEILEGIEVISVFDAGELLRKDLFALVTSGAQAILLVIIALFFTIGWRESLLAGLAIPLSFIVAFIALYFSGNTLNFISLFSLILAIGIIVDSAIVMVEGINRRMKQNPDEDKVHSALGAIQQFYAPLTSGTLTTVAVFAPLFFISGVTGEFIKSIPFTIIFLLLASLFVALGLVPLFASLVLRRRNTNRFEERQQTYVENIESWYAKKLSTVIGNRKKERFIVWGSVVLFFLALSLPILGLVKVEFFPAGDTDFIIVEIEKPVGTPLAQTDIELRVAEELLYGNPEILSFLSTAGASSPYAGVGGSQSPRFGNIFINLKEEREKSSLEIMSEFREGAKDINTASIEITQPSSGPPVGRPIVIRFLGDSFDDLTAVTLDAERILREIDGVVNIRSTADENHARFLLRVDAEKAGRFGLNAENISQTLRIALSGVEATIIPDLDEDISVVVSLNVQEAYSNPTETNRATIDDLLSLSVATQSGPVLLGSLLTAEFSEGSVAIRHNDLKRTMEVSADIAEGANLREILQEYKDTTERTLLLPVGVSTEIGGENEETDQAFMDMFYALIVGLVLMLAILVYQFNSFRHALYVLSVTPLALIGVLFGLLITNQALSFPTLMGFIALVGIVVNNSIILIDMMNTMRKENPQKNIREVVIESARTRLRPIVLTTITTVLGVFPLVFASEIWAPLAWAIIFGLLFSVFLTLLVVPILYSRKPGKLH